MLIVKRGPRGVWSKRHRTETWMLLWNSSSFINYSAQMMQRVTVKVFRKLKASEQPCKWKLGHWNSCSPTNLVIEFRPKVPVARWRFIWWKSRFLCEHNYHKSFLKTPIKRCLNVSCVCGRGGTVGGVLNCMSIFQHPPSWSYRAEKH